MELLPLRDVYTELPPTLHIGDRSLDQGAEANANDTFQLEEGKPIQMTYCGGSRLDYIWTSKGNPTNTIKILKTMVFHEQAFQNKRQKWPSPDHPSDHIPVGFEFQW